MLSQHSDVFSKLIHNLKNGRFDIFIAHIAAQNLNELQTTQNSKTILHFTLELGNEKALHALLQRLETLCSEQEFNKFLMQADSNGWTSLHYSARYSSYESFKILREKLGKNFALAAKKVTKEINPPLTLVNSYRIVLINSNTYCKEKVPGRLYIQDITGGFLCMIYDDWNDLKIKIIAQSEFPWDFKPERAKDFYPYLHKILICFSKASVRLGAYNPHADSFKIRNELEKNTVTFSEKKDFLAEMLDCPEQAASNNPLLNRYLKYGYLAANYTRFFVRHCETQPYYNSREEKYRNEIAITRKAVRKKYEGLNLLVNTEKLSDDEKKIKKINNIVAACKEKDFANCGEMAVFVIKILILLGVSCRVEPIEFENGDHTFVLMARASHSKLENYKTWGKLAIVVDPWLGVVFPAEFMEEFLGDYKEDPVTENNLTFPFDPEAHKFILSDDTLLSHSYFLSNTEEQKLEKESKKNIRSTVNLLNKNSMFVFIKCTQLDRKLTLEEKTFPNLVYKSFPMINEFFNGAKETRLIDDIIAHIKSQSTQDAALSLEEFADPCSTIKLADILAGIKDTHTPLALWTAMTNEENCKKGKEYLAKHFPNLSNQTQKANDAQLSKPKVSI